MRPSDLLGEIFQDGDGHDYAQRLLRRSRPAGTGRHHEPQTQEDGIVQGQEKRGKHGLGP